MTWLGAVAILERPNYAAKTSFADPFPAPPGTVGHANRPEVWRVTPSKANSEHLGPQGFRMITKYPKDRFN
jgi:hypothetical protein